MAFIGAAVISRPSTRVVRITGLSLDASASGTISLDGGGGDVELPAGVQWSAYAGDDSGDDTIDLDDAVEVSVHPAAAITNALLVSIVKVNGPFLITLANGDGVNTTPDLEIYLRFH